MNDVLDAAIELQSFCQDQDWQFCFIGGIAVQHWGEPRLTRDADLTLLTGFGDEEAYIDALLNTFGTRRVDSRQFALQYRVLLLKSSNGIPLDISLGAMPFEERSIQRAILCEITPKYSLQICSAEDLIVHKAFANRPQDWVDIGSIIDRQKHKLDINLIVNELTPLAELKDAPEILDRLQQLISKAG